MNNSLDFEMRPVSTLLLVIPHKKKRIPDKKIGHHHFFGVCLAEVLMLANIILSRCLCALAL